MSTTDTSSSTDATDSLPDSKPTCVADLETIVYARRRREEVAHIPCPFGDPDDEPAPFCRSATATRGIARWCEKPITVFPEPDEWFSLCKFCLEDYDREVNRDG